MRLFHFKLFWITRPGTLCEVTSSNCWPSISKWGRSMGSFRKQCRISLHFLALSFIQLLWLHEATVLRLVWMFELLFLISPSDSDTSSTYFQVRDSGSGIFKFLIITRNNIGLSFVPWGTPAVIWSQSEVEPANLMRCRRFVRKLIIHGIKYVRPSSRSFSNSTLYPMRSKALEKSRKQRRRCLQGESRYVSQVWIMPSKQHVVWWDVRINWNIELIYTKLLLAHDFSVAFQWRKEAFADLPDIWLIMSTTRGSL